MAKPSGPDCNLGCEYCFYLEKNALFPSNERKRMSDATLEAYIRNTIESSPVDGPVLFTWQGGEPTLLGIDFYKKAVALQKQYGGNHKIENSFQSNGTLIDSSWAEFLAENRFLVGLSLDGPESIHDRYRRAKGGAATHRSVMEALELLQRHAVPHNILTCVNRISSQSPLEVYRFLKYSGVQYIQFIPIVERLASESYVKIGLSLDGPPSATNGEGLQSKVTDWSVRASDWGGFLTAIFEEWRRIDVGSIFVMNFEWSLAAFMNQPGVVCVHRENCGRAIITEHNGDVYSCDHFVYPEYRLGNLSTDSIAVMLESARQQAFGRSKSSGLPDQCRRCKYLRGCWGGCPKHRFINSDDGQPGLNYLCAGYTHYLHHIAPYLKVIAGLIGTGRQPAEIMNMDIRIVGR
jgi:uncharacterized protein